MSGGLLRAMNMMRVRQLCNPVGSILLLTDGQANVGISNHDDLLRAVAGMTAASPTYHPSYTLNTFGFGSEHSALLLRRLSDAGHGMYFYVAGEEDIPQSFADCIGGLLSVVAQNIEMEIRPYGSHRIVQLNLTRGVAVADGGWKVDLGDIQSGEERNIPFQVVVQPERGRVGVGDGVGMSVGVGVGVGADTMDDRDNALSFTDPASAVVFPDSAFVSNSVAAAVAVAAAAAGGGAGGEMAVAQCRVTFFNVITNQVETAICEAVLRVCGPNDKPQPSVKVGLHRTRVQCAETMARAQELAETRNYEAARALLEGRMAELSLHSTQDHADLRDDVRRCLDTLVHEDTYRARGSHIMSSCSQTHWAERSNVSSHPRGRVSYSTPFKDDSKKHVKFFKD